jgi:hypothetical protein
MVNENSLFHLVRNYHLDNDEDCFNKAISLAENELDEVLKSKNEREYPPFIYYLCLEQMDNNPKYKFGKTFCRMTDEEKISVFNETISALRELLA